MNSTKAAKTADLRWKEANERSLELCTELNAGPLGIETHGVCDPECQTRGKETVAAVEAEVQGYRRGHYRSVRTPESEHARWQGYCREHREILRELEDVDSGE